ncbi:Cytochrome C oxidase subunit 5C, partial [Melia azedarach]
GFNKCKVKKTSNRTQRASLVYLICSIRFSASLRLLHLTRSRMAGHKIAHATLKGPSVVKEICIGIALGLAAGSLWKMHHWNEQRKVRAFYDLLEKGEISVVAEE